MFNANFIANDGYASLGLVGIIIMGIVYSALIYFIDIFSSKVNLLVVGLSLTYIMMFQGNVSLFTLLLSHGLVWLFVVYFLFSKAISKNE